LGCDQGRKKAKRNLLVHDRLDRIRLLPGGGEKPSGRGMFVGGWPNNKSGHHRELGIVHSKGRVKGAKYTEMPTWSQEKAEGRGSYLAAGTEKSKGSKPWE